MMVFNRYETTVSVLTVAVSEPVAPLRCRNEATNSTARSSSVTRSAEEQR